MIAILKNVIVTRQQVIITRESGYVDQLIRFQEIHRHNGFQAF